MLDTGPYPCGRVCTFTSDDDGRVSAGFFQERHQPVGTTGSARESGAAVRAGFSGVEAVEMRDGYMWPLRRHRWWASTGEASQELLLDAAALPFTDVGFLTRHCPEAVTLFAFDVTGDVATVDWDAVRTDEGKALILRAVRRPPVELREAYGGFMTSLMDACAYSAWRAGRVDGITWQGLEREIDVDRRAGCP